MSAYRSIFRGVILLGLQPATDWSPRNELVSVEHAPTVMTADHGKGCHMQNIAKNLDSCNVANRPKEIVIHGPRTEYGRDSHVHPWSAALISELVQFGWNIFHDENGRIEAIHHAFMGDA